MMEYNSEFYSKVREVAMQAIQKYVQGILMVEVLTEQMLQEWQMRGGGEEQPSLPWLKGTAQRMCSRALCEAWRSERPSIREQAFENLRRYLHFALSNSHYGAILEKYEHATEDVLQQALEELYVILRRQALSGPNDPGAFLKWARTIVRCHAYKYVEKRKKNECASLDAQAEEFAEEWVDRHHPEPHEYVIEQEVQQFLENAIRSLRNPRYQQVLWYILLYGMTEKELADHLQIDVNEIYLRKCRALKALRRNARAMERLRSMLQ